MPPSGESRRRREESRRRREASRRRRKASCRRREEPRRRREESRFRREGSRGRRGSSLIETLWVLVLLGVLLAAALPRLEGLRDRMAVRGAREAIMGLFSRARHHAVLRGGAEVWASEELQTLELRASGLPVGVEDLGRSFGVELEIGGSAGEAVLRYDGLGLGRMASRTLTVRRGAAEAAVVISSYGRARRR